MKAFVPLFALVAVFHALPVSAAPDYSSFDQSVTNYFAALNAIVKKLPSVENAAGTAEVINAWALANEIFADAAESFADKHPELRKLPAPPPEFAAAFGRLNRLKTDYPTLPTTVGALGEKFKDDPDVQTAFARFQKSLIRLHISGSMQKSEPPPATSK